MEKLEDFKGEIVGCTRYIPSERKRREVTNFTVRDVKGVSKDMSIPGKHEILVSPNIVKVFYQVDYLEVNLVEDFTIYNQLGNPIYRYSSD